MKCLNCGNELPESGICSKCGTNNGPQNFEAKKSAVSVQDLMNINKVDDSAKMDFSIQGNEKKEGSLVDFSSSSSNNLSSMMTMSNEKANLGNKEDKKKKKISLPLMIVIVVILLGLIGGGIYYFVSKDDNKTSQVDKKNEEPKEEPEIIDDDPSKKVEDPETPEEPENPEEPVEEPAEEPAEEVPQESGRKLSFDEVNIKVPYSYTYETNGSFSLLKDDTAAAYFTWHEGDYSIISQSIDKIRESYSNSGFYVGDYQNIVLSNKEYLIFYTDVENSYLFFKKYNDNYYITGIVQTADSVALKTGLNGIASVINTISGTFTERHSFDPEDFVIEAIPVGFDVNLFAFKVN